MRDQLNYKQSKKNEGTIHEKAVIMQQKGEQHKKGTIRHKRGNKTVKRENNITKWW